MTEQEFLELRKKIEELIDEAGTLHSDLEEFEEELEDDDLRFELEGAVYHANKAQLSLIDLLRTAGVRRERGEL